MTIDCVATSSDSLAADLGSAQVLQKLMRHANISLTMTYYANVDDAATEAVLNRQRNTLRNTEPNETVKEVESDAATDGQQSDYV